MTTLVLLPGMDGTGKLFNSFISSLGAAQKVIVVSYPDSEALGYAELEVLARAAIPKNTPFILVGESFSGPIAISIAASAPDQLKGLILCCSFARNPHSLFSGLQPFVSKLPISRAPFGLISRLVLGKFSNPSLRSEIAQAISNVSLNVLRARLKAVLGVDVSDKLKQIKVPIFYLRAAHDRVVPRSASEFISSLLPSARIIELDAPHFLLQTASVKAAEEISKFAREVEALD
jgi:pimeloyl-[acyl-carrier protein] methyl ester esterase